MDNGHGESSHAPHVQGANNDQYLHRAPTIDKRIYKNTGRETALHKRIRKDPNCLVQMQTDEERSIQLGGEIKKSGWCPRWNLL